MSGKHMDILNHQLVQIEAYIPSHELTAPRISTSSMGWHLLHSLMVINGVCGILANTKPENYKKNINLTRAILFSLGYFPRGKAKAPKVVVPPQNISTIDLHELLDISRRQVEATKPLPEKSHFIHHIFGMLSKKQTLHFLTIHTKHHLKIVSDILKQYNL